MKEQWKKQMQQKMADYRESDIEVSWAEIENALAKNRQQAKVVPLWLRRVAAAAVFLLMAGGGYWYWTKTAETKLTASAADPAEKAVTASAAERVENEVSTPIAELIEKKITAQIAKPSEKEMTAQTAVSTAKETTVPAAEATAEEMTAPTAEPTDVTTDTGVEPTKTQTHQEVKTAHPYTIYPSDLRKSTSLHNRLTAKVYLSNMMASSSMYSVSSYQMMDPVSGQPDNSHNGEKVGIGEKGDNGDIDKNGKNDETEKNQKEDGKTPDTEPTYKTVQTSENVQHHQPIRFGFSLRYRLDKRWSLESGLTYTRLTADITNTVDGQSTTTEQSLNYIGIPLSASYLLWGNRHFSFYLSAGGLVEKMVKGSRTTQGVTNSVSIHPLQVSVNGVAGAEFKFNDNLSLYAEPALNYYFDNGSSIPTLYQEKPLNFNLNVGIRFNIK